MIEGLMNAMTPKAIAADGSDANLKVALAGAKPSNASLLIGMSSATARTLSNANLWP
jgi:hypothetical protein